eukprot:SAG31_NODE_3833_length_3838_cov_2.158866_2_plen_379_part_00
MGDGVLVYGGPSSNITSWGGGPPAFDAATGMWTLFVTEIDGHCGLSEWETQSTVVAAIAASPAGPFRRGWLAVGRQAHNPYYAWDPSSKTHVIFHIGDGRPHGRLRNCTDGTTPPPPATELTHSQWEGHTRDSGCPGVVSPCGSWVHFSPSLAGPFQRMQVPFNTRNKTTESTGFVMDNPAPFIFENGTVILLIRKINNCAFSRPSSCSRPRALTEIWLARAPSFRGPYEIIGDAPITSSTRAEDPAIYRDVRGNFHAIFHGPGHAWSTNALDWSFDGSFLPPTSPAKCKTAGDASGCGGPYVATLRRQNGSVEIVHDAERPRVWVNQTTGLPELLFFSSGGAHPTAADGHTRGITIVQRIRRIAGASSVSTGASVKS